MNFRLVHDRARYNAKRAIDEAPDGWIVTLKEPTRTTDQNARMWAMLGDIAKAKPQGREMTTDQWKGVFMDACGHKQAFVPTLDGKDFIAMGFRSSKLSIRDMSDLMECMAAYGSSHGVNWSDPTPFEQPRHGAGGE